MRIILCLLITVSSFANLVGEGKLEYGIFGIDLYNVRYYKTKKSSTIQLIYLRDIAKKYSIQGWQEGFKLNLGSNHTKYSAQIEWVIKNTPDVLEGDSLTIKIEGNKVELNKNKATIATRTDEKLAQIIHLPWIGPSPVDKELKAKLLGQP